MNLGSSALVFKFKLGVGIAVLLLAVGTFLAANGINEMQVEEDAQTGNISVEFKDADIHDVFRVLALKGNVSIVADPEVKGLVTVQITDVPWEKVLDVICRTYGYAYERETNIIRVTTLEKQGLENLVTEVFGLNYANAKDVSEDIAEMKSERGKIRYNERANLIIVTDIPTNIYKVGKIIKRLDSMTPQVCIEAKIIETALTNDERLGMKWNMSYTSSMSKRPTTFPWHRGKPGANREMEYDKFMPFGDKGDEFHYVDRPAFPLATADDFSFGVLDGSQFSLLMEAIAARGKTTILSNPRITTMDNVPAKIHVGTDWPIAKYSYNEETDRFVITGWEYKSYGILLEVTPTINKDGYITLKVHPEISDMQDVVDFQGATVPILSTQTTDATVMVKDGETIVMGGLLKDKVVTTRTKVPILGDIPILGLLFSHKINTIEKKDLLIFITPHIIGTDKIAKRPKLVKALESTTIPSRSKPQAEEPDLAFKDEGFLETDELEEDIETALEKEVEMAIKAEAEKEKAAGQVQELTDELEASSAEEYEVYFGDEARQEVPSEETIPEQPIKTKTIESVESKGGKIEPLSEPEGNKGYLFKRE